MRLAAAEKFIDPQSIVDRLESLGGVAAGGGQKKKPSLTDGANAPRAAGNSVAPVGQTTPAARPTASAAAVELAAGEDGAGGAYVPAAPSLSTEEKRQVHNDPEVKELLSLFGGEVVDVRRAEPPAPACPGGEPAAADVESADEEAEELE